MIDSGDTAWVLTSSALVFFMVPGLAFFYAGLVRSKNTLGTLMQSFIALGIVGLTWVLWGYSLSFGPSVGGFIGNLEWVGLRGVSATEAGPYADTIPHQAFMVFQAKFAIITPALIAGAFAERIKFSRIRNLHSSLVDDCVLAIGPLDVGNWGLARRCGGVGLCRRRSGAHQLGGGGRSGGADIRPATRVRQTGDDSPQRAVRGVGGFAALVWMVWI